MWLREGTPSLYYLHFAFITLVPHSYGVFALLDGVAMGAVSRPHTSPAVIPHALNIAPSTHNHVRTTDPPTSSHIHYP